MSSDNRKKQNQVPLSVKVRELIQESKFDECYKLIVEEMKNSPHAAEPHNLLGMLLEQTGEHLLAIKHFRVSWDLDPTYLPARYNLYVYESFSPKGIGAYDENDCPEFEEKKTHKSEHEERYNDLS